MQNCTWPELCNILFRAICTSYVYCKICNESFRIWSTIWSVWKTVIFNDFSVLTMNFETEPLAPNSNPITVQLEREIWNVSTTYGRQASYRLLPFLDPLWSLYREIGIVLVSQRGLWVVRWLRLTHVYWSTNTSVALAVSSRALQSPRRRTSVWKPDTMKEGRNTWCGIRCCHI